MTAKKIGKFVKINKIILDSENPRHEVLETSEEIIDYLCKNEDILALAKDIAKHGTNPLELLAILPGKRKGTYISREGNRRLCALKLLTDPDLAPANIRKSFEKLSNEWTPITELPVVEFAKQDDVDVWLQRIHNGTNGGIGRKRWTAQQQARHTGEGRNKLALEILDYAEDKGFITSEQRKNKITTVQRFFNNPLIREAMGLDRSNPDSLSINRPEEDFDLLLKEFLKELLDDESEKVSSRRNKPHIEAYARELSRMQGLSGKITEPKPIEKSNAHPTKKRRSKPKKPPVPSKLSYYDDIADALKKLGNYKLSCLYFSICDISVSQHTPLIAVGLWSFIESLTADMGSKTDIIAYFSKQKLNDLGFDRDRQNGGLRQAFVRISHYGNTTKHDAKAATFDSKQLANDFDTMRDLILVCVNEAIAKK
ncbi:MAG: hypothetical protein JKY82_09810 [Rhizobiaceae bacterium]|nr:hypothetical protein [Rhizobiaceae bacterium]